MRKDFEIFHQEMLYDIKRCLHLPHPEKENAETCFWIARKYWNKLLACIKRKGFRHEHEEVDFFRNVKPQFTCMIEYFVLLSAALQFEPKEIDILGEAKESIAENDWKRILIKNKIEFWESEAKRCQRYYEKNTEFITYYESGRRDNDRDFFLRKNDTKKEGLKLMLYDNDEEWLTTHDQLLRSYLAYRKFKEYVNAMLENMNNFNLSGKQSG